MCRERANRLRCKSKKARSRYLTSRPLRTLRDAFNPKLRPPDGADDVARLADFLVADDGDDLAFALLGFAVGDGGVSSSSKSAEPFPDSAPLRLCDFECR